MSSKLEEAAALSRQRYKVLAAVMLGGIMGPIDASIVNVILPTMAEYFHAPIATAQWVPDSPSYHQQPVAVLLPPGRHPGL